MIHEDQIMTHRKLFYENLNPGHEMLPKLRIFEVREEGYSEPSYFKQMTDPDDSEHWYDPVEISEEEVLASIDKWHALESVKMIFHAYHADYESRSVFCVFETHDGILYTLGGNF